MQDSKFNEISIDKTKNVGHRIGQLASRPSAESNNTGNTGNANKNSFII